MFILLESCVRCWLSFVLAQRHCTGVKDVLYVSCLLHNNSATSRIETQCSTSIDIKPSTHIIYDQIIPMNHRVELTMFVFNSTSLLEGSPVSCAPI